MPLGYGATLSRKFASHFRVLEDVMTQRANRTLDLPRRIFKWGIEEDLVAASPCYPIKKPG